MTGVDKNKIAIIGGGRWGRVLVSVLGSMRGDLPVVWISQHNLDHNQRWLNQQSLKNVDLGANLDDLWHAPDILAVVVATPSDSHARMTELALSHGLHVYSEKPYCYDADTAQRLIDLAQSKGLIAGVNLEFSYASYLHDFKDRLSAIKIRKMEIVWQDPFFEVRHGEIKHGDVYTPLVHDALPHCWSLVNILADASEIAIRQLNCLPDGSIDIVGDCGDMEIAFSLNRRADGRKRKIIVNDGEASLDFAVEPGAMVFQGQAFNNEWKGARPLGRSLQAFLTAIDRPHSEFLTSFDMCLPAVRLSERVEELYRDAMEALLEGRERHGKLHQDDPATQVLLVDLLLPEMSKDQRFHIFDEDGLALFVESALKYWEWMRKDAGQAS